MADEHPSHPFPPGTKTVRELTNRTDVVGVRNPTPLTMRVSFHHSYVVQLAGKKDAIILSHPIEYVFPPLSTVSIPREFVSSLRCPDAIGQVVAGLAPLLIPEGEDENDLRHDVAIGCQPDVHALARRSPSEAAAYLAHHPNSEAAIDYGASRKPAGKAVKPPKKP